MNIFYVDHDPKVAAQCLTNSHCLKMIVESCQMLCTTFHLQGIEAPYKATHKNHPSNVWTRSSEANFKWLMDHTYGLLLEYTKRYGKIHKSVEVYRWCLENSSKLTFPSKELTPIALAMPDEYKVSDSVQSYRNYYKFGKTHLHAWKLNKPDWI